jgi:hypothetical protein
MSPNEQAAYRAMEQQRDPLGIARWLSGSSDEGRDQQMDATNGIAGRLQQPGPFNQAVTDIANGLLQPGRFDQQQQNTIANMANNPYEAGVQSRADALGNPTANAGTITGYGNELAQAGPYEASRNTLAGLLSQGPANGGRINDLAGQLAGTNPYTSQQQGLLDRVLQPGGGNIDMKTLGGMMASAGTASAGTASAAQAAATLAQAIAGGANGDISGIRGVADGYANFDAGTAETLGQNGLASQRLTGVADGLLAGGKTSREDALMSLGLEGNAANDQLAAQLAARGLSNSGAAASQYGSLTGNLIGQRAQLQRQLDQEDIQRAQTAGGLLSSADSLNLQRIGQNNSSIAQRLGLDLQSRGQQVDAYGRSGQLAQADDQLRTNVELANANAQTSVSQGNAQMATQASISNAGNQTQASIANAGNRTQVSLANSDQGLRAMLANQQNEMARYGLGANMLSTMSDDRYRSLTGAGQMYGNVDQSTLAYQGTALDAYGNLEGQRQSRLNGAAGILQGVDGLQTQRDMGALGAYDNMAGRYDNRQQGIFGAQNTMQQNDWMRQMQAAGLFNGMNEQWFRNLLGAGGLTSGLANMGSTPSNGANLFNGLISLAPAIIGAVT